MLLLSIWDPYYCAGKVKVHLMKLGFTNVVNENQDFYAVANTPRQPEFDVLLTSPPYSRDHIQKCMQFAVACGRAWFILQPQYVHRKKYYSTLVAHLDPMFMVPGREYVYYAHHGGRKENTKHILCRHWERDGRCPIGDRCAFFHGNPEDAPPPAPSNPNPEKVLVPITPFKSIWHIHMGSSGGTGVTLNDKTYTWALQKLKKTGNKLFRRAEDLPQDQKFISHRTWTTTKSDL